MPDQIQMQWQEASRLSKQNEVVIDELALQADTTTDTTAVQNDTVKPATADQTTIANAAKKALVDLYTTALNKFKKDKKAMHAIVGLKELEKGSNAETAAMVIVAGAMLNMDEWLNKN